MIRPEDIKTYEIRSESMTATVLNYGAILSSLKLGNRQLVIGFDDVA